METEAEKQDEKLLLQGKNCERMEELKSLFMNTTCPHSRSYAKKAKHF